MGLHAMSLHRFLTRLIWLCVIPLMLAASWLGFERVRAIQAERDIAAANLAQNLATAIDQHLGARIAALQMLAASPLAKDASRRRDLYVEAQGFRESFDAHVILADLDLRMLLNTRAPFGATLPVLPRSKGRAAAPAALETGAPAVGDIVPGPIAGEPLVAIAVPGKRDGKTSFLLLATFETRQFQRRLDRVALPAGWSLALVDGSGATIARRAPPGMDAATDVDAAGRSVAKSALAPWSVVLEIPRDIYRAPLLAAAVELALLILAATLVGVFGGLLASRRLGKSVSTLSATPAAGVPPPEITEIAAARRLLDAETEHRDAAAAELRESEQYNRLLFDASPVGLALCRMNGELVDVNPAYAAMLGRSVEETLNLSYWDITPEHYAEQEQRQLESLRSEGSYGPYEKEYLHVDGHLVPVCLNGRIIERKGESFIWSSVEDIAERKRSDALRSAENTMLTMIASSATLATVLETIAGGVETISRGTQCSILLLDADGVHVRHGAAPSLPAELVRAIDGQPIGPNAGSCGTAMYRNQQVIVTDIATDPLWADYRAFALPLGLRACWSTPIRGGDGRVLGSFALYDREPRSPIPIDLELIERLTHVTSIAIERCRAEAALRESEARIRNVFEQANDGIYIISAENRYLDANPRGLELLGYTHAELLQLGVADVLAPEEVARLAVEPPRMMSGIPHLAEWQHVRKDGSMFPGEVSARRLDEHSYLAIVRDLSERRRAEAALRESEAKFRAIIEASPVAMAVSDAQQNIRFLNPKFVTTFGYTLADIPTVEAWWPRAYPDPAYRQRVAEAWQAGIDKAHRDGAEREAVEYAVTCKDGTVREIRFSMAPMGTSSLVIFYDLTERKRAEDALQKSELSYRTLIENAADAIFVLTPDGRICQVNSRACEMFGYSAEEFVGMPASAIIAPDQVALQRETFRRVAAGERVSVDRTYRRKDGSVFAVEINACQTVGGLVLGIVRDVTERKKSEQALADGRARLEALTRRLLEVQETERRAIARELHDEVGGVLTAVKLNLQALRRTHTAEQGDAALIDGLALVDGAIQAVRSLSLDLRPAVLDDLGLIPALKWYCERQAQRAGVTIDLALDAIDLKAAPQLESACYRIVQEAVNNALRHAGARRIQVTLRRGNGLFMVEITDDGAGFELTAARRRGLAGECGGLLGMEERAKLLGGELVFESAPGSGVRVRAQFGLPEGGFA